MALKKRVEVLFEQQKFSYLERKAKREKTSVGNLIREAVEVAYLTSQTEKRRRAVASLLSAEYDFGASWEELKEEIAEERYRQTMKSVDDELSR
jgi:predicted CopG family antitoxin